MKNKLTTLGLGLAASLVFSSCGDKKKELEDAANKAKESAASLPTDAKGLATAAVGQMEKLTTRLESVTDLESAKKAVPDIEKIGGVMQKIKAAGEKLGGDKKFEEVMGANPDLKNKFEGVQKKMMAKMIALGKDHPDAAKLIGETLGKYMPK